jgi:N utilization substance protein B
VLRRKARVVALQVLYETDCASRDPVRALENGLQERPITPATEAFARSLIDGVLENRAEIDTKISAYAPSWPISQMAAVDRNILRVAIFEILFGGETPPKVAINEAVELGKVFGSDSSSRFVNGVLGAVMEAAGLESDS